MDKIKGIILCALFFIAAAVVPAQAVGNIHISKLEIHPYLSLQEILSDNIYSTSTDQKSDRIAQVTPGVMLRFPFRVHTFEADYHTVIRKYDTYKGEDTDDHTASGKLDLHIGSRLSLKLNEQFNKGHEPRGTSATGFIEVFRRSDASATATYQLVGRSKVQINYRQTGYNFVISNFRDRDEDLVAGYVYYRFMPKTSAFIEFDHKTVNFIPDTTALDNTMDYLLLGLTWEATAKSKGTIKAGQVTKDFENALVNDVEKIVLFVDLDHKFTEYASLLLSARRDVNETNYLGATYYITTGFTGEFTHRFGSKFSGLARFSYGKDEFSPQTSTRIDKTMMEGAGVRYSIRDWFEVGADYNYRSRNSNIDANDHRERQTVLSINMVF